MDDTGYDIGPQDEEYQHGMDLTTDNPPDIGFSHENNISSMPPEYTRHQVYGTNHVVWRRMFEEPIDMTPPEQNPLNRADACPQPVDIVNNPLHMESNRLKTFEGKWPAQTPVTPKALARDGFYYIGPGDRVRCAFCTGVLKLWDKGDVVSEEHKKHFPHCVVHRVRAAGAQVAPDSSQIAKADSLGIVINQPKYPQYALESTRLRSFNVWPSQMKQKPADLAKAGLFYLGKGDRVKCFTCGHVLSSWEPTDNPMAEHERWFPTCPFVRLVKGDNSSETQNGTTVADTDQLAKNASVQALIDNGCKLEDISKAIEDLHMDGDDSIPSAVAILEKIEERSQAQNGMRIQNGHSQSNDDVQVQSLLNENRELKEQRLCKVCLENEISVIFLPCGHLVCCSHCATSLSNCPICRVKINGSAKAYWP
ncbi:E3 ubiquitin-protein ligase XIAP-like [Haliotis rubra]|uniref:E3 ubiquitin-protein ligase XIAP-like n=1 Tax=Haliotis rubra TaxID=36100 RepID=UPI001EE4F972|nr:E3 ubiquitin-protein ligase XIAP-like [Haliotis rubra]XP_046551213.1 E3 ubiquitin-protein ligase XIAP-like [Haliotis rubra]